MISVSNLTKYYGSHRGVENVNFELEQGAICGLLGPNGAGKSTTIRMLTGYMPPTSGDIAIAGHKMNEDATLARQQIGYLPETNPLYPELRANEYLHFIGKLYGLSRKERHTRLQDLIPSCGMEQIINRPIGQLSKGNRQRVGLASALIHNPKVLILDEPTSGLDPTQMIAFRDLIFKLKGKHTVLISSHYIPQLEQAADRVIILAKGTLMANGTPHELRAKAALHAGVILEVATGAHDTQTVLNNMPRPFTQIEVLNTDNEHTRLRIFSNQGQDIRKDISNAFAQAKIPLLELRLSSATLEDFFTQTLEKEVPCE